MSSHVAEALLCRQCLIDLSTSDKDVGRFSEEFFAREAPHLDHSDRLRILYIAYEIAGARMETLKDEAMNYLEKDPALRDPVLSLDALHRYDLSRQYVDLFKRLGSYLTELQRQGLLPAS